MGGGGVGLIFVLFFPIGCVVFFPCKGKKQKIPKNT